MDKIGRSTSPHEEYIPTRKTDSELVSKGYTMSDDGEYCKKKENRVKEIGLGAALSSAQGQPH